MKGKSITFNKYFVYVMILVATLILCVATFSLLGINKAFTPSAEGEVVTSVTSSLEDDNLTVEGLGTHYFKDDAVFTITSNVNAGALELIGVNATYTTGDNAGKVVTLAKEGSTYALYGVTGDFTLKGNWVAKSFTATWSHSYLTLFNQDDTAFDESIPVYYGIGIPAADMPYAKGDHSGTDSYNPSVWSVTGTLSNGSSYTENHIPANAITAKCTMSANNYTSTKQYAESIDTYIIDTKSTTGVNFAPTTDIYTMEPDRYKWFKAGALAHNTGINSNSYFHKSDDIKLQKSGLGFFINSCTGSGYSWFVLTIPVHFDGKLKQDIASGKYQKVTVEVSANIQVGICIKATGKAGRSMASLDVAKGVIEAAPVVTQSGRTTTNVSNYPVEFTYATTSADVNTDYVNTSDTENGGNKYQDVYKAVDKVVTENPITYENDQNADGFTIGFRTMFYDHYTLSKYDDQYNTNYSEHYAFINTLTYTITADNVQQTYKLNLDSNNPDGVESELISTREFATTFDSIQAAPWSFEDQGYSFKGWSTEKGGEIISDSLKVLEGQTETTYYANWEKKNYAYVTAEDYTDGTNNVSEVLSTEIKEHGTSVTIPNRNEGDKYIGFNYDGLSPSGVSEGDTIPLTGSMRIGYKYSLLSPEVVFNDKEVTYGERINLASLTEITSNPLEGSTRTNRYTIAYTLAGNPVVEEDLILVLDSGEYLTTLVTSVDIVALSGEIITLSTSHSDTANLNISKRVAQIVWPETLSFTYDAMEKAVAPTISNVAFEDDVALTVVGSMGTDASDYCSEITAISDADNYALPLEGLTKEWSILARELTVSKWVVTNGIGEEATELIYDGKSYTAQAIIENAVTEIAVVYENEVNSLAGTYTAKVSLGDTETNYVLADEGVEYAYVIAPRMVEVSWDYVSPFTYDATEKKVGYTFVNKVSGDSVTLTNSGLSATNAGDYTAKITAVNNANYALPEGGINLAWTIQKRTLSVAWGATTTFTYSGNYQTLSSQVNNILSNEIVYFIIEIYNAKGLIDGEPIDAGTYTIKYDGNVYLNDEHTIQSNNYILDVEERTFTINPKKLYSVGDWYYDGDIQYIDALPYRNKAYTLTSSYISAGVVTRIDTGVKDVEPEIIYENNNIRDAGKYQTKMSLDSTNYVIGGNNTIEWEILPLVATLAWTEEMEYTYDGTAKTVTAVVSNAIDSDVVTLQMEEDVKTGAGNYTSTIKGILNANYSLPTTNLTREWVIKKANIEGITLAGGTYTYDRTKKTATLSGTKTQFGEDVTSNFTVETDATSVGDHVYTAVLSAGDNYNELTLTATVVIEKADITGIELKDGTFTFDNTEKSIAVSKLLTQYMDGASVIYSGGENLNKATNAGEYTIVAIVKAGNNYNDLTLTATLSINKANVSGVKFSNKNVVYNATAQSISIEGASALFGEVTYTINGEEGNSAVNVGTYTIVAKIAESANYNEGTVSATLTINKATIEGFSVEDATYTYNKEEKTLAVVGTTTQYGDEVTIANGSVAGTDAGTYTLSAIVSSANYEDLTLTATLTINKATIEGFSVENATHTYDKEEKSLAVVGTTTQYGDEVTIVNGSVAGTNAGNYNLRATVSSANYFDLPLEATLTIEKADIEGITLVGGTYTYDKEEKVVTLSKETTQYGDEVEVVITGDSAVKAGTYTYTAVVTAGDNYNELSLNAEIVINKATIEGFSVEDATYTYDNEEKTLAVVGSTTQYGDEVTIVNGSVAGTNAGTYTLSAIVSSTNYFDLTLEATLTIEKADIEGITLVGGTYTYDKEEKVVTLSKETTQYGDEVEVVITGDSAVNAGTYTYTAVVTAGDNYNELSLNAEIIINKATIDGFSVEDATYTYDKEEKSLAVVGSTTTQYGDEVTIANGSVAGTDAGNYTLSATVSSANYEDLTLEATLTIEKADIEGITLVGGTYTYDKEEKIVTLSKETTQYGDGVEVVITGDSAVNAGTYTYTAVVTAGDNYNELSLSADVIIEKKNISVIGFTDGNTTYGIGDTISYTYSKKEITFSAVYGEDDVIVGDEVSFVVSGNSAINAGKNTLKVTLEENENYNMSPVTKAWSIAPKTLEVEWIGDAKVSYNGEAHEVEAILVGVIEGDVVELTTSGSSNVNAGSYTAKAISLSNNNYTISVSEYKYEIEKATIKGISLVGLSTTYTGEQFSLAISDKETQFGDAVSVSYKYVYGDIVATEGVTEAGDYEVTATVTAGANYEKLILSARLTLKPVQMESEEGATIETEEGFTPGTVLKTKTKLYSANEKSEYVVEHSETERIALAIEVSLTRNDVEVTPEGIMVLRLALPEEMQNVEFRMLAILGNETVEVEYTIEDDCVVVETDELCTYVFVTEYTTTEKLVAMLPYIIGGIVALALVIGVVVIIVIRSKKHTIKFVSNGVELKNSLGSITAKYGQKVSLPTPSVGGMYFEGCYSDPECTKKAKVSDLRDGDAQFYSKRVKTPRGNIKVPQAFLDTVKFGGWYLDEGCTIKADLNKMGKKDVTLYAKWSKKSKKSSYKVYPWEK